MKLDKIKKCSRFLAIFALATVALTAFADLATAAEYDAWAKEATTNGWRGGYGMTLCPIKLGILLVFYLVHLEYLKYL